MNPVCIQRVTILLQSSASHAGIPPIVELRQFKIDFLCMMDFKSIRKVNLIEHLSECYPHVEDLSSEEIHAWDENQIRAYYTESQESPNRDRSAFDEHVQFGFMQLRPNHYQR